MDFDNDNGQVKSAQNLYVTQYPLCDIDKVLSRLNALQDTITHELTRNTKTGVGTKPQRWELGRTPERG
jgi:hypothetical protein